MPRGGHPAPGSSRKSSRLRAPPEHKIGIFVRFLPSEPPFSGISSTKSRFLCAFAIQNPSFQAFLAQNRHFCARAEGPVASGSVKVTFLQFTARANVPQRCLEQGFVRAVICRNCATNNQQHYLPPNTCVLAWQQHHPAPNTCAADRRQPYHPSDTCAPGHAIASFGEDTEVA